MIPLDIAGTGLSIDTHTIFQVIGTTLKLIGGSFMIFILALLGFAAIVVRSFQQGIFHSSLMRGLQVLIRSTAYAIGAGVALMFMLLASTFFSVSFLNLFLVAILIAAVVGFVARQTFMFLIFKRFGKYILYLTTLHRAGKVAYNYVKTENNQNPNNF